MSDPPLRRRDRHGGLSQDYFVPMQPQDVDPRYYGSQSPPRNRHHEDPAPRRHKSERRRPITPELVDDPYEKPSRRRSRRDPHPEVVNPPMPPASGTGGSRRAHHSREPYVEPRDHYAEPAREHRSRHGERQVRSPPGRDPYDPHVMSGGAGPAAGYGHDPRDPRDPREIRDHRDPRDPRDHRDHRDPRNERPPRSHRGEPDPDPRPRRSRHSPPPPDPRVRGRDPYEARGHPRDYPARHHSPSPPRRHRSQRGGPAPVHAPEPSRGRPPPATSGRHRDGKGGAPPRRSSMPASTKARAHQWWQNPMIQAGARTAFTAGARAAMQSKNEDGPWMGPKGAKVATAALGAAFMDGIVGGR